MLLLYPFPSLWWMWIDDDRWRDSELFHGQLAIAILIITASAASRIWGRGVFAAAHDVHGSIVFQYLQANIDEE